MSWKTRLFGTRLRGKALNDLLKAADLNWLDISRYPLSGKCRVIPSSHGLGMDLYVYRTDSQLCYDEFGNPGKYHLKIKRVFHYFVMLPYESIPDISRGQGEHIDWLGRDRNSYIIYLK